MPAWLIQVTSHKCFHKRKEQQRYVAAETAEDPPALIEERKTPQDVLYQVERGICARGVVRTLTAVPAALFFEPPAISCGEA